MARNQTLVIDASVALKWFVNEINTKMALEVREELTHNIIPIVPHLFFYEIANVLRYKPEFGSNDVKEIIHTLKEFQFKIESFDNDLIDITINIAYEYGITIYDASYVAISKKLQTNLITADNKLYTKLNGKRTILLKNWTKD